MAPDIPEFRLLVGCGRTPDSKEAFRVALYLPSIDPVLLPEERLTALVSACYVLNVVGCAVM